MRALTKMISWNMRLFVRQPGFVVFFFIVIIVAVNGWMLVFLGTRYTFFIHNITTIAQVAFLIHHQFSVCLCVWVCSEKLLKMRKEKKGSVSILCLVRFFRHSTLSHTIAEDTRKFVNYLSFPLYCNQRKKPNVLSFVWNSNRMEIN